MPRPVWRRRRPAIWNPDDMIWMTISSYDVICWHMTVYDLIIYHMTAYDVIWQYIYFQGHPDFSYFSVLFRCLSMHAVTSHTLCIVSCRQKWKNRCADHASGKFVYPGIYWYSTVYTLTYDHTQSCTLTPNFRAAPYISDDWTSIQLPSMHVSSSPAVKSEQITFLTMH